MSVVQTVLVVCVVLVRLDEAHEFIDEHQDKLKAAIFEEKLDQVQSLLYSLPLLSLVRNQSLSYPRNDDQQRLAAVNKCYYLWVFSAIKYKPLVVACFWFEFDVALYSSSSKVLLARYFSSFSFLQ